MARTYEPDDWLSRKEAALYLTSIGCPLSHQTLANLASNDNAMGGPSFTRIGWRTIRYQRRDLDTWAHKRVQRVM